MKVAPFTHDPSTQKEVFIPTTWSDIVVGLRSFRPARVYGNVMSGIISTPVMPCALCRLMFVISFDMTS